MTKVNWAPAARPGIEAVHDATARSVVVRFEADGVPSCTMTVVTSMHAVYDETVRAVSRGVDIAHLVLSSKMPGIFNMGGDLGMMATMARAGDRRGLAEYGRLTAGLVHRTWDGLGVGLTSVAAIDGDAFGGGCEAALSATFTLATRASRFAFPETRFGLYPGMGATSLVGRRASPAFAAAMIGDGRTLAAADAVRHGLVDRVVASRAEACVLALLRKGGRGAGAPQRRLAEIAAHRRRQARYTHDEAMAVVAIWVDAVLAAPDRTLTHIERIVKAQRARVDRIPVKSSLG